MSYNIGPKIYIDGEKEFRDSISKLNTEYKTLEAQTKALTAEFEANGDEIGKLTKHSEQLEKQIDVQKRKMDQLEDAVSKATAKYGDNSVEANRLKGALYDTQNTLVGLESELKDTKKQLSEMADGMEDFEEETEDASEAALDFSDVLGANFVSDLALDALKELGQEVVEFAKGSLDAAAEVTAAGSQFEQAFDDMEDTARKTLEKISKDTNVAVTRMQGNFTQMYAFSKTSGADTAEAMDIASRALVAAADSAAYYDKTIEEATEQLQAFLKGNYANDAALGISATETTRNAKANELYATSFNKLSESQKVDVLLSMVEAGNKASGALGQAAREADSWANVQGELDEALLQMQAVLGQPALEAVIPIVKGITEAIYELMEVQEWENLENQIDGFVDSVGDANKQFASTTEEIKAGAFAADWYVKRLAKLEAAGLDTAESQREYAAIVEQLNTLLPDLNLTISEQTGLVEKNAEALLADIEAWKQRATAQALQEQMTRKVEAYAAAEVNLYNAQTQLMVLEQEHAELMRQYSNLVDMATVATNEHSASLQFSDLVVALTATSTDVLSGSVAFLIQNIRDGQTPAAQLQEQIRKNEEAQAALSSEIEESKVTLESYSAEISDASESMALFEDGTESTADDQSILIDKLHEVQAQLEVLQTEYDEARTSARESIDSQIGLFDVLATESEMSASEIVENWRIQRSAFDNYTQNMKKAIEMGLDEALVKQLSDGSEESMLVLAELVTDTGSNVGEINRAFRGLSDAKDTTAGVMAEIRTGANAEMVELVEDAQAWGEDIIDGATEGLDDNAYKFRRAMKYLAISGNQAFRDAMDINSPSGIMIDNSEDTVAGGVVGIDRNIRKFEAAMEDLAEAGNVAFLEKKLEQAEFYPNVMEIPVRQTSAPVSREVNYGGFNIQIYQTEGEDSEALAYRVADVLQADILRREVSVGA